MASLQVFGVPGLPEIEPGTDPARPTARRWPMATSWW
jgi:hypothetical protein